MGAGRTDAGVHALQIFAHFEYSELIDRPIFLHKINGLLPDDIAVLDLLRVKDNAHARFDATRRSYEYRVFLGRSPFNEAFSWQLFNKQFDVALMNQAADLLLKTTNFKCFSRAHSDVRTFDCMVSKAFWLQKDRALTFYITADRFLRNMVRAIVGTLIEVGEHKTSLEQFQEILDSQNRCFAGPSAPAKGLFLKELAYPKEVFLSH